MAVSSATELAIHVGHNVTVASYGSGANVTIECEDCWTVLVDYEQEERHEDPEPA